MEEVIRQKQYPKGRKSLAVDLDTYNLLQEICSMERRSKVDQLRLMIEVKHNELTASDKKIATG
jgi:hypothetical protein